MNPAFAQAKKTTTCSGELPVSVAMRSPPRTPRSSRSAASVSDCSSSSRYVTRRPPKSIAVRPGVARAPAVHVRRVGEAVREDPLDERGIRVRGQSLLDEPPQRDLDRQRRRLREQLDRLPWHLVALQPRRGAGEDEAVDALGPADRQ